MAASSLLFYAFFVVPAAVFYGVAFRGFLRARSMLTTWPRRQGTVVDVEVRHRGTGQAAERHVHPVVEWVPEGRVERFTPSDYVRRGTWEIGAPVTLLRHPTDWRQSRVSRPGALYWREAGKSALGATLWLLVLAALWLESALSGRS